MTSTDNAPHALIPEPEDPPANHNTAWVPDDDFVALRLYEQGRSYAQIGKAVERKPHAARKRIYALMHGENGNDVCPPLAAPIRDRLRQQAVAEAEDEPAAARMAEAGDVRMAEAAYALLHAVSHHDDVVSKLETLLTRLDAACGTLIALIATIEKPPDPLTRPYPDPADIRRNPIDPDFPAPITIVEAAP